MSTLIAFSNFLYSRENFIEVYMVHKVFNLLWRISSWLINGKFKEFLLIDPMFIDKIRYCKIDIEMNFKERKKDYLIYLLYLFGVIPSEVLKNHIVVQSFNIL